MIRAHGDESIDIDVLSVRYVGTRLYIMILGD